CTWCAWTIGRTGEGRSTSLRSIGVMRECYSRH
ncbi:MAG: hypothetical protein AVDCRST_MAG43-661, partial [uncultured Thermomicrobiales bacterium]